MKKLINSYYDWLKENTICESIGEYTKVSTPFLDRHNDCIEFYIKLNPNGNIFFTDDGYVLDDLESYGFNFNSPRRKKLLNDILSSFHITLDDGCLTSTTTVNQFAITKHFYIQAIMAINDLYNLNKPNITSLFTEDFNAFLDNNDIFYTDNVKITGKSGFDHYIDYVLPGNRKNPGKYLKVINNPDKSNTENTVFMWDDLKHSRKSADKMMVVLNNVDNRVRGEIINAYKNYDIEPLLWSDKDSILASLKYSNSIHAN